VGFLDSFHLWFYPVAVQGLYNIGGCGENQFSWFSDCLDRQPNREIFHRRRTDGLEGRKDSALCRKIFQLAFACVCNPLDWRIPCDKMVALKTPTGTVG